MFLASRSYDFPAFIQGHFSTLPKAQAKIARSYEDQVHAFGRGDRLRIATPSGVSI